MCIGRTCWPESNQQGWDAREAEFLEFYVVRQWQAVPSAGYHGAAPGYLPIIRFLLVVPCR